jgi:hypothetical protein
VIIYGEQRVSITLDILWMAWEAMPSSILRGNVVTLRLDKDSAGVGLEKTQQGLDKYKKNVKYSKSCAQKNCEYGEVVVSLGDYGEFPTRMASGEF